MDGRSGYGWMLMACLRDNKQDGWMYRRMHANAVRRREWIKRMDVWVDGCTCRLWEMLWVCGRMEVHTSF